MPFTDLPNDILLLIFDFLAPTDYSEWKVLLGLISLNQNLRQVFFHKIYKHVFMTDELEPEEPFTNLGLVAHKSFASHLHIKVSLLPNKHTRTKWHMDFLRRPIVISRSYRMMKIMINLLYEYSELCSRVDTLSVNTSQSLVTYHPMGDEMDYINFNVELCTESLIRIIPGIRKLILRGRCRSECDVVLQKTLLQGYAAQLSKLYYSQCERGPDRYVHMLYFSQITDLKLALSAERLYGLPQICLQTIQCMEIEGLHPKHTWALFSRDPDNSVVVPYLRKLKLSYIGNGFGYDESNLYTMQNQRLHFPRLQVLELDGDAKIFPLLNMAVLPDQMEKISILAKASTFTTFSDVTLPAARSITCNNISGTLSDGLPSITLFNQLLQNSLGCVRVMLYINARTTLACADQLCCPGLTTLKLTFKIDFSALMAIIASHPRLARLSLTRVSAIPLRLASTQEFNPLSTSIRELHINYSGQSSYQLTYLKHLMLRLQALESIHARYLKSCTFKSFVRRHLANYPHLANIKYKTNSKKLTLDL
ncbi:hypothetical protein BX667DRAFT_501105 [Coemansia mojavensis]|nr:hypothetical protein BX667DRAFT_501105 [Coemansia mojavensis]